MACPARDVPLYGDFAASSGGGAIHRGPKATAGLARARLAWAEFGPQIAELLRVDQSTVHRWFDRYEAEGLAGLSTEWSDGRPPVWDEAYEWLLVETMRHDPRWYGLEQSLWTCSLLAGYLAQETGIRLSAERVRVLMHQHGIRLKQPTLVVHSRDPLYDPKG